MIGAIECADALALPGVVAIFTGADVAAGIGRADHVNPLFHDAMRRPFVAYERVHYVGQPVVAIVSETRAVGMDAVDLVYVDYDLLPVVVDPEESRRDEVLLHPGAGTNVVHRAATPTPPTSPTARWSSRPGSSTSDSRRRPSSLGPAPPTGPTTDASCTTPPARVRT